MGETVDIYNSSVKAKTITAGLKLLLAFTISMSY